MAEAGFGEAHWVTGTLSMILSSNSTAGECRTKNRAHVSEFPGLIETLNLLSLLFSVWFIYLFIYLFIYF